MGNQGTTKYPSLVTLGSPFTMKTSPFNQAEEKAPKSRSDKRMDKLSAKHKELYDKFEMGQTTSSEESKMYRLEDRMGKIDKKSKKK
jgi:hypothetical protein|tara:strand:+ start:30 stop:290 length:261 start_codon:yes stop_codon:yes gene_type:complete